MWHVVELVATCNHLQHLLPSCKCTSSKLWGPNLSRNVVNNSLISHSKNHNDLDNDDDNADADNNADDDGASSLSLRFSFVSLFCFVLFLHLLWAISRQWNLTIGQVKEISANLESKLKIASLLSILSYLLHALRTFGCTHSFRNVWLTLKLHLSDTANCFSDASLGQQLSSSTAPKSRCESQSQMREAWGLRLLLASTSMTTATSASSTGWYEVKSATQSYSCMCKCICK